MRVWFLRSHIYNLLDTLQIGLTVVVFPLFNHVLLRLRPTSEVDDGGGRLVDLSDLICLIVDFTYAESPHFPQKTVSFCLYLSQQFALTDITVLQQLILYLQGIDYGLVRAEILQFVCLKLQLGLIGLVFELLNLSFAT